jgi:PAS domain-containing protein
MNPNEQEAIEFLREQIADGEHWYLAMLKAMSRWSLAEESIGGRNYRYLIGGEAFDWLVLAERLLEELDGQVTEADRHDLLFNGRPPLEVDDADFQLLIGTPKYQAYLNFLYGVTVEEALIYSVEEEIAKEHHSHAWAAGDSEENSAFRRIYGKTQDELLGEFFKERKLDPTDRLDLTDLKEFTYLIFQYRVRTSDGARVSTDKRKGLVTLSRIEANHRSRTAPEPLDLEINAIPA